MRSARCGQLRYYIALSAPPNREVADGTEAFVRPVVGFGPSWFHKYCGIDFSQRWHEDPVYRLQAYEIMRDEIRRRFPRRDIGGVGRDDPPDLVTGTFGTAVVAAMFGQTVKYAPDKWPAPVGKPLADDEADALEPLDLENNAFFNGILDQVDRIEQLTGTARGVLNWHGPLNTAFRLRGEQIFVDLVEEPHRAHHLFECVATTVIRGVKKLHGRQRAAGVDYRFSSTANCVVNMIRPEHYAEHVLPFDLMIRAAFEEFGIHNCAWVVDPYMEAYASVPDLGYLDMGLKSDFLKARRLFPGARRTVLYTPMDLANKTEEEVRADFERIARELAPCDVGLPNQELDLPDGRVILAMELCEEFSDKYGASRG